eukprot:1137992-Pelagomonas_calceolata.AAC.2
MKFSPKASLTGQAHLPGETASAALGHNLNLRKGCGSVYIKSMWTQEWMCAFLGLVKAESCQGCSDSSVTACPRHLTPAAL